MSPGRHETSATRVHPKVTATAVAGAATTLILWGLTLLGVTAPPEVAGAITTLIGVGVAYLVPS